MGFFMPRKRNYNEGSQNIGIWSTLPLLLNSCLFISHFPLHTSSTDVSSCKVSYLPHKAAWQNFPLISAFTTAIIILIINKLLTPLRNKHKWQGVNVNFKTHVNKDPVRPNAVTFLELLMAENTFHWTWKVSAIIIVQHIPTLILFIMEFN